MTIVICIRDPDSSNEYRMFGEPQPMIIDVDYGYLDLNRKDEFDEWAAGHMNIARTLETHEDRPEFLEAAKFLRSLVEEERERYGHGGES